MQNFWKADKIPNYSIVSFYYDFRAIRRNAQKFFMIINYNKLIIFYLLGQCRHQGPYQLVNATGTNAQSPRRKCNSHN